eukprot:CAMPEP_0119396794 /NCGR_PEP_ID=MMETSP1334-20130426/138273_1 /TAXON_ID=127549 /ORGANISM="Calcidiscus leptoporus, Strain RCC1130" /LENGTH=131 /DNA_ID=CAMNT_0007420511 /DNA_START=89 /DNA_END=484 /DNA_ORIENTATION=+
MECRTPAGLRRIDAKRGTGAPESLRVQDAFTLQGAMDKPPLLRAHGRPHKRLQKLTLSISVRFHAGSAQQAVCRRVRLEAHSALQRCEKLVDAGSHADKVEVRQQRQAAIEWLTTLLIAIAPAIARVVANK